MGAACLRLHEIASSLETSEGLQQDVGYVLFHDGAGDVSVPTPMGRSLAAAAAAGARRGRSLSYLESQTPRGALLRLRRQGVTGAVRLNYRPWDPLRPRLRQLEPLRWLWHVPALPRQRPCTVVAEVGAERCFSFRCILSVPLGGGPCALTVEPAGGADRVPRFFSATSQLHCDTTGSCLGVGIMRGYHSSPGDAAATIARLSHGPAGPPPPRPPRNRGTRHHPTLDAPPPPPEPLALAGSRGTASHAQMCTSPVAARVARGAGPIFHRVSAFSGDGDAPPPPPCGPPRPIQLQHLAATDRRSFEDSVLHVDQSGGTSGQSSPRRRARSHCSATHINSVASLHFARERSRASTSVHPPVRPIVSPLAHSDLAAAAAAAPPPPHPGRSPRGGAGNSPVCAVDAVSAHGSARWAERRCLNHAAAPPPDGEVVTLQVDSPRDLNADDDPPPSPPPPRIPAVPSTTTASPTRSPRAPRATAQASGLTSGPSMKMDGVKLKRVHSSNRGPVAAVPPPYAPDGPQNSPRRDDHAMSFRGRGHPRAAWAKKDDGGVGASGLFTPSPMIMDRSPVSAKAKQVELLAIDPQRVGNRSVGGHTPTFVSPRAPPSPCLDAHGLTATEDQSQNTRRRQARRTQHTMDSDLAAGGHTAHDVELHIIFEFESPSSEFESPCSVP